MTHLLLRSTIATLVAFAGGGLGAWLGAASAPRLRLLVYAAMGSLLAVTLFDVLPDAKALLTWPEFLAAGVSGYGLFWLVGKYVSHLCPACSAGALDKPASGRLEQSAMLLIVALGLHAAMDGLAVVVGDGLGGRPNLALLLAVSFHKLPEGLALVLLLVGGGYTRTRAFWWAIGVESLTEAGALLGIFGLHRVSLLGLGLIFAHVGGGFVYLAATTFSAYFQTLGAQRTKTGATSFALASGAAFTLMSGLIFGLHRWLP